MHLKKSISEDEITKTFVLKVNCGKDDIISLWKPAANEFSNYYNKLSKWIGSNLTSMKIGDLAKYIDNKENEYYKAVTDESKKDLPLYKIFKGFSSVYADNAMYCMVKEENPEEYNKNILCISESNYRKNGYFQCVMSNFRTKMSSLKTGIKQKKIDPNNVDEETLKLQTAYEVSRYGIEKTKEFEDLVKSLKTREETPQLKERIERLSILMEYYKNNEDAVKDYIDEKIAENLQKFGCCIRKSLNSISIFRQNAKMTKDGNTSFNLELIFNKKPYIINMLGNRQIVRYANGQRNDIIDITEKHGCLFTFTIKENELFTHITTSVKFNKNEQEIRNAVGVDVNIKHMLLATSIVDDGKVKGYVNLYRELCNDKEFKESFKSNDEFEAYRQISETVNFGVLETESLFGRVIEQQKGIGSDSNLIKRESAIRNVFDNILKTTKDRRIVDYINYVKMLRAKYKAYFILKEKYYERQKEYDLMMGFTDESTESKESMDARRSEFPFANTREAQEILTKLQTVGQDIIGCRDNIVTYAFNIFKDNGFDTISLEYLDSSQFTKMKMPTPLSLLKYHKLEGKTEKEVETIINEKKFHKSHYKIRYNNETKLVDNIEYSNEGIWKQKKLNFMNLIIKAVGFADIKDKFVQLCNNNHMNTVFCPSAFTSQMDSITHALYFVPKITKDKKGREIQKFVLANKNTVRSTQERHINGLNADYNSARNLKYIAENETLRNDMTDHKTMYGVPTWNIKKSFKKCLSAKTIETFRNRGNVVYGYVNENGEFVKM